jgi:hypothetical protein
LIRVGDKPVAAPRHSLNKLNSAGTLAERLSQQRNVLCQISFLDKRVGPDPFHQVVFSDDLPAVLNERHQNVEYFGSEWNRFTFAQQDPFRGFEAETAEFVTVIVLLTHKTGLEKYL